LTTLQLDLITWTRFVFSTKKKLAKHSFLSWRLFLTPKKPTIRLQRVNLSHNRIIRFVDHIVCAVGDVDFWVKKNHGGLPGQMAIFNVRLWPPPASSFFFIKSFLIWTLGLIFNTYNEFECHRSEYRRSEYRRSEYRWFSLNYGRANVTLLYVFLFAIFE
jgi:hypothetical protein